MSNEGDDEPLVDGSMLLSAIAANVCTSYENFLRCVIHSNGKATTIKSCHVSCVCHHLCIEFVAVTIALVADSDVQMWPFDCFIDLKSVGGQLRTVPPRQVSTREPNIIE